MDKIILHCDANNFYASVETLLNPKLRGLALAVSGNPDKRHGIVLAKSEQAKKYGVKTGDTIWEARMKCPEIIFVLPQYEEYVKISNKIFEIYTQFTDKVEPFGIDECWLDVSGCTRLFGSGEEIANKLREKIKNEIGITISVGVSFTKIFAKIGSDMKKPDATTVITKENYKKVVWDLPIDAMLMIGNKTKKKLNILNIFSLRDLALSDVDLLIQHFGINGKKFYNYVNGIELENVRYYYNDHIPSSVGNSTTTPHDMTDRSEALAVILGLSEMIAIRLRRFNLFAKGVSLGIKFNNFTYNSKQAMFNSLTNNAFDIYNETVKILDEIYDFNNDLPLRLIAISTYKLSNNLGNVQKSFFDDDNIRLETLEKSVDVLRGKYGYDVLKKGLIYKHLDICEDLEDSDFLPFKK